MFNKYSIFILVFVLMNSLSAQVKRPIEINDLFAFGRIADYDITPNGNLAAISITYLNKQENRGSSAIWFYDFATGNLEKTIFDKKNCQEPVFSPDGKLLAYSSTKENGMQIWIYNPATKTHKRITGISSGASSPVWSPDGKHIAFISEVYPECENDDCNKKRDSIQENSKVKARILTDLPFRVWNSWKEGKRSHLFIVSSEGGTAKDLTPGNYDTPPIDLGGKIDYCFSPDSKEICFVRNMDPLVAISTNNDLFITPIEGGKFDRITISKGNDNQPVYSPDGKYIAYKSMKRAAFEADKYDLILYDRQTGEIKTLTEKYENTVDDVVWSPDSKFLYFSAQNNLNSDIYKISFDAKIEPVIHKEYATNIKLSADGRKLFYLNQSISMPPELFAYDFLTKKSKNITNLNNKLLNTLDMAPLSDFWFEGAEGAKVQGFIVKPPSFDENKKYPAVLMIHGGPQGAWSDNWTYRWNAQLFASKGYVVIAINPRGSKAYGQKFCDEISGDWGGKVYEDLMKGLDYAIAKYKFIDANKLSAAGGSYGGYMVNWLLGHSDRFKCFVSHASVFNLSSMYGATEELWFVEWDMKGTPWNNPEMYKKFSPLTYASNFKTPTLVIHGEQDFRVPISEGLQLFTALKRQGVPAKFLYFPDEGHFVLKPQNSELWYNTIFDWWKEYLK